MIASAMSAQAADNVTITNAHHALFGGGNVVYIDGEPFAKVEYGKSIKLSLPVGEHMVAVRRCPLQSEQRQVSFEVKRGKRYAFRIIYAVIGFDLQRDWIGGSQ
jgi:hypothetical protein